MTTTIPQQSHHTYRRFTEVKIVIWDILTDQNTNKKETQTSTELPLESKASDELSKGHEHLWMDAFLG